MKRIYVQVVRVVAWPLRRLGVLRWLDRRTSRRGIHFARSLFAIHDVDQLVALDVPWWSYRAIDEVERWMADRADLRAFEWGSGASTVWLGRRVASLVTVEHHEGWAERVRALADSQRIADRLDLHVVAPVEAERPVVPSGKEGHDGLDFADYVASIDRLGGTFDLISIDGRAREACLDRALDHLADDGLIVFDNTDRARYRDAIATHPELEVRHLRGVTPSLPYPTTTTVLRRS